MIFLNMSDFRKSKTFKLLSSLRISELEKVASFVKIFDKKKGSYVSRLCNYIVQELKNPSHSSLEKSRIWIEISNRSTFKPSHFNVVNSELLSRIEKYLMFDSIQFDSHLSALAICSFTERRGFGSFINSHLNSMIKKRLKRSVRPSLESFTLDFVLTNELFKRSIRLNEMNNKILPLNTIRKLDQMYVIHTAHLLKDLLLMKENYQVDGVIQRQYDILKSIFDSVDPAEQPPQVKLMFDSVKMMIKPCSIDQYNEFKESIFQSKLLISKDDLRELLIDLSNYSNRLANEGFGSQHGQKLEVYKFRIANNLVLNNLGELSDVLFKNIVINAIKSSEIEFALKFIHNYSGRLKIESRALKDYAIGMCDFALKNYPKALESLLSVKDVSLITLIGVKTLLLKIYFETDAIYAYENHSSSMKRFLYSQKSLSRKVKKGFLDFVKALDVLNKIKWSKQSKQDPSNVVSKYSHARDIVYLKAKIEEIKESW